MDNNTNYHFDNSFFKAPLKFGEITLYQIGRLYSNSKTKVDTHVHRDLYELTVVTDGCGVITTNGTPVKVSRGDIYFSFPCDTHKIESDAEKLLKYDFFAFNTENAEMREELEKIMLDYSGAERRVFCDERVSFLVGNAISEINGTGYAAPKLLECIFVQILVYSIRNFMDRAPRLLTDIVTTNDILCYRMMNYIDTHIHSLKKLEELADVMGYSYGYLSSLYKKTTSNTLADYYRHKKLEIARLLVLEKKMKMSEIAEMLNYASVYAFSKAFKNRFGISPENYCKKYSLT
ncbi:MAG: AraC family transcriptional regulator [Ruminococcaceae bacterium]|nr:AraC family transcriptional regulator [Oscillospiraceae bacterium]